MVRKTNVRRHLRNTRSGSKTIVTKHERTIKKKGNRRTIKRRIPDSVIQAVEEIAREQFEWAIGLDYEDNSSKPFNLDQIIIEPGNEDYVWKISDKDIEIHIHTHTINMFAYPSDYDLESLVYGQPQIIISDFKEAELYNVPRINKCAYYIYDNELFKAQTKNRNDWAKQVHNNATISAIAEIKSKFPEAKLNGEFDKEEQLIFPILGNYPSTTGKGRELRRDYYNSIRRHLREELDVIGIKLETLKSPYEIETKTDKS